MILFIVIHKIGEGCAKYDVHNEAFFTLEDATEFCKKSATQLLQDGDELVEIKQTLCKSGYGIVNKMKMKHKFMIHRIIGEKL